MNNYDIFFSWIISRPHGFLPSSLPSSRRPTSTQRREEKCQQAMYRSLDSTDCALARPFILHRLLSPFSSSLDQSSLSLYDLTRNTTRLSCACPHDLSTVSPSLLMCPTFFFSFFFMYFLCGPPITRLYCRILLVFQSFSFTAEMRGDLPLSFPSYTPYLVLSSLLPPRLPFSITS